MMYPPPRFEQQKNEVLQRYRILNGSDVYVADQIVRTAAQVFSVPMVVVSLNERYRNWYRSVYGVQTPVLERLLSFCAQANLSDLPFAVSDVRVDVHFASDPVVEGPPHVVFFAGAPLRDPDGKRFGSLCLVDSRPHEFSDEKLRLLESFAGIVSQDICVRSAARYAVRDLIEAEHDKCGLFDMAMTDPLTKALNRRAFYRFAEREVMRAGRHGKPVSAMLFDIDHFKQVNDVHGHGVGDEVLTRLVECVTRSVRDEDLLGRLGGEEFAMVLPETEPLRAVILANRIRESVSEMNFAGKTGPFRITISIGISEPGFADLDILPALERADSALYQAKRKGRNRVELAPLPRGESSIAAA
jgi:diguanylate cyclase (GGDEF)-like protein